MSAYFHAGAVRGRRNMLHSCGWQRYHLWVLEIATTKNYLSSKCLFLVWVVIDRVQEARPETSTIVLP